MTAGALEADGQRLPRVTVHFAQTLDGRIATRTGHSQWISCQETLKLAHQLRADHRAVMVGAGTVCADNPRLTVRLVEGESPLRVIADSTLRLPLDAHVLTDGGSTIVATTSRAALQGMDAIRLLGAEVLVVGQDPAGRVDLRALLYRLGALGISSLLIEGGAGVITSALRDRLVDRLVVCIAPKVIGAGRDAIGDLGIRTMDQALQFSRSAVRVVGEDIVFDGELAGRETSTLLRR
jgi:5-amino-6-(5-phosphoribosylamino)uracil reductase/diaminohydroxyphosphoribosylaminopyrimidine deaminase/5-amino-6-(5-phosphoribosylamino)uracil reductase